MVLGSSEGLGVGYICVKCRYIIEVNLRSAIHAIHIHEHVGLSSKCMVGIGERGVPHDVELLFMFFYLLTLMLSFGAAARWC